MANKWDTIARQEAGLVPGYMGADEGLDAFAAREAAHADELAALEDEPGTAVVPATPAEVVDVTGISPDLRGRIEHALADERAKRTRD